MGVVGRINILVETCIQSLRSVEKISIFLLF